MFASVIIDNPSSATDYEFEYIVPEYAQAFIKVGCRVKVKFGTGERLWMGYVIDLHKESLFDGDKKELVEVLDLEPLLNDEMLYLGSEISKKTLCSKISAYQVMLPKALKASHKTNIKIKEDKYIKLSLDVLEVNPETEFHYLCHILYSSILLLTSSYIGNKKQANYSLPE